VFKDLYDHLTLVNEADNADFSLTVGVNNIDLWLRLAALEDDVYTI